MTLEKFLHLSGLFLNPEDKHNKTYISWNFYWEFYERMQLNYLM